MIDPACNQAHHPMLANLVIEEQFLLATVHGNLSKDNLTEELVSCLLRRSTMCSEPGLPGVLFSVNGIANWSSVTRSECGRTTGNTVRKGPMIVTPRKLRFLFPRTIVGFVWLSLPHSLRRS